MFERISASVAVLAMLLAWGPPPASAAPLLVQTWVSGVGDDANDCSRTAPCATFAAALDMTAAGGEIRVLDPGEFGAVTIYKSVSIVGNGRGSSIINCGCSGVLIDAGASDVISIRGLQIEGAQVPGFGLGVVQAGSVYVADTVVRGFRSPGFGIAVANPDAATRLYLNRVQVTDNDVGIYVEPAGSERAALFIDGSVVEANDQNALILVGDLAAAAVNDSRLTATPTILEDGAKLVSLGNNFIFGATPTSTVKRK